MMADVQEFCDFLSEKGLPSHIIEVIEEAKITRRVMQYMEEDIAALFPAMGEQFPY